MMAPDPLDLFRNLVRWLAVPRVQVLNVECLDPIQRVGERRQAAEPLRRFNRDVPVPARIRVQARDHLVPAEQRSGVRFEKHTVSRSVSRRRDQHHPPVAQSDLCPIRQLLIRPKWRPANQSGPTFATYPAARVIARPECLTHPFPRLDEAGNPILRDARPAHVIEDVLRLVADDVASVQERLHLKLGSHHWHPLGLPAKRQTAMVDMSVRNRDVPDVANVQTRRVELRRQRLPGPVIVRPGVDHDHAVRCRQRVRPVVPQRNRQNAVLSDHRFSIARFGHGLVVLAGLCPDRVVKNAELIDHRVD